MEDDTDDRDDTKRRSRNLSEKKRRDQFNSLVNDLSALISTSNRKMDKSTVLKSTIAFLKHHNEATDRSKIFEIQQDWKPSFLSNDEFTQLMLESLDGFIIVFGSRGSIFYTSDSVTAQLGYLPCDLMKMTIFDLSYEMDHESLFSIFLNPKPVIEPMQTDIGSRNQITFFLHLKRGGIEDVESNSYELVKFVGYFRNDANVESVGHTQKPLPATLQRNSNIELDSKLIFVGTGRLQMPQMIREITVTDPTCNEFTSKHSMEWKFLFLDHRAPPIIGYMPFEVLGTSGYDYYHFDDIDDIVTCHEELVHTGKGKSSYYRFLTKGHQWIWLQTEFFISYNQFNAKPDYVVCTHKVINYNDVLKYHKSAHQHPSTTTPNLSKVNVKSSTVTLRDLALTNTPAEAVSSTGETTPAVATSTTATTATSTPPNPIAVNNSNNVCNNASLLSDIISNAPSPSMDTSTIWTNPPTPTGTGTCHLQPMKSNSRAPSSYGNISSTGISPNVKRKRYMYNCRGNESDSTTSMSADSGTSRQSLMTHMSSSRQRFASGISQSNFSSSHHQHTSGGTATQHHSHMQHQHHHHHQPHQHQHQQQQMHSDNASHHAHGQKLFAALPQHGIVSSSPVAGNAPCQFPQPAFPIRSPQIVAPSFLDSSQYLAAIPVQPVIAPFQVAPVLSPLPVSFCTPTVSTDTGTATFSSSSCFLKAQNDMLSGPVVMTSTQSQLQEQLQRKHDELQKLIIQQQDELRIVSEQLLLARYTLLQPMMSMNYGHSEIGTVGNNTRNYSFNNNAIQQQFNQYGFAMNSSEMQQQQMMAQQQQHLEQQMQQNHPQHHQEPVSNQQQHMQQSNMQQSTPHQQQQHHDQMLLNRNVPDLDQFAQEEFDAFLNLSPLQNMGGSQTGLNPINPGPSSTTSNTNANNANSQNTSATVVAAVTNNPSANNVNLMQTSPYKHSTNNPPNSSEDSLFSYMQIAAASSPPSLNFPLSISDGGGAEGQSDDNKIMPSTSSNHQQRQHLPLVDLSPTQTSATQRQQQRSPFFPTHPFSNITGSTQSSSANNANGNNATAAVQVSSTNNNALQNELNSLLPYPLAAEQPQTMFNSNSHPSASNQ